jgi:hypothetical protein
MAKDKTMWYVLGGVGVVGGILAWLFCKKKREEEELLAYDQGVVEEEYVPPYEEGLDPGYYEQPKTPAIPEMGWEDIIAAAPTVKGWKYIAPFPGTMATAVIAAKSWRKVDGSRAPSIALSMLERFVPGGPVPVAVYYPSLTAMMFLMQYSDGSWGLLFKLDAAQDYLENLQRIAPMEAPPATATVQSMTPQTMKALAPTQTRTLTSSVRCTLTDAMCKEQYGSNAFVDPRSCTCQVLK